MSYISGRHVYYVNKEKDIYNLLPSLPHFYPKPIGLKIIKSNVISDDGTPYYTSNKNAPSSTWITMKAVGSIKEKMIISNMLSLNEMAPRVFDLIKIKIGHSYYFALIVEHVEGKTVTGH